MWQVCGQAAVEALEDEAQEIAAKDAQVKSMPSGKERDAAKRELAQRQRALKEKERELEAARSELKKVASVMRTFEETIEKEGGDVLTLWTTKSKMSKAAMAIATKKPKKPKLSELKAQVYKEATELCGDLPGHLQEAVIQDLEQLSQIDAKDVVGIMKVVEQLQQHANDAMSAVSMVGQTNTEREQAMALAAQSLSALVASLKAACQGSDLELANIKVDHTPNN